LQGGIDRKERERCIRGITALDFPGFGIGGLSIGESREAMMDILELTTSLLPPEKPVYLMGLGSPLQLLDSIKLGIDIFDSVFPARHARHHTVLSSTGQFSIKSSRLSKDTSPLAPTCQCRTCRNHTRSYIHHLMKTGEFGWMRLITIHNITFIQNLMANAREAILEDRFEVFRKEFTTSYTKK